MPYVVCYGGSGDVSSRSSGGGLDTAYIVSVAVVIVLVLLMFGITAFVGIFCCKKYRNRPTYAEGQETTQA